LDSVELLVFNFCLHDDVYIPPFMQAGYWIDGLLVTVPSILRPMMAWRLPPCLNTRKSLRIQQRRKSHASGAKYRTLREWMWRGTPPEDTQDWI